MNRSVFVNFVHDVFFQLGDAVCRRGPEEFLAFLALLLRIAGVDSLHLGQVAFHCEQIGAPRDATGLYRPRSTADVRITFFVDHTRVGMP